MTNLPDIDKENQVKYLELMRLCDPEMYMIRIALDETKLNAMIVPSYLRLIGNLLIGTGYGKIITYVQARKITNMESTEKVHLDMEAVME